MSDWASELEFALHLADVADAITLPAFRRGPQARRKADGTLVTAADEEVERVLRAEIAAAYPSDAVLGEEGGETGGGGRRWILDPIDGTNNFSWGIPIWGTLIALEVEGQVVLGVASAPALGERYHAARGRGARRNGEPIRVSAVSSLAEARVAHASFQSFAAHGRADQLLALLGSTRASRGLTDFWGHALVAAGSLEVMVEPVVETWDLAAVAVIVEEAGGRFTDLQGRRRIDGRTALSSNGILHDEALALFAR